MNISSVSRKDVNRIFVFECIPCPSVLKFDNTHIWKLRSDGFGKDSLYIFFPLRAESFLTLLNTVRKEVVVVSLLQKRLILLQVAATDNRVTQSTPRSSCAMWGACPKCALHNMLLSFAAWFSAVHWSFWIFGKPKHFATIKLPVEARVELCFWKTGSNENWNLQVASSLSYISSRRFLSKVLEETCSKRICQNIHTCTGQCKLF